MQSQHYEASQTLVKHYIMISLLSFLKTCCAYLFDFVSRRTVYLKVY